MFLLYKQESYEERNELGELYTHFCQAEDFSLWDSLDKALTYVQDLIEKKFRLLTNKPANFHVEDDTIKFSNILHGKVIEECNSDYYVHEIDMPNKLKNN